MTRLERERSRFIELGQRHWEGRGGAGGHGARQKLDIYLPKVCCFSQEKYQPNKSPRHAPNSSHNTIDFALCCRSSTICLFCSCTWNEKGNDDLVRVVWSKGINMFFLPLKNLFCQLWPQSSPAHWPLAHWQCPRNHFQRCPCYGEKLNLK